MNDAESVPTLEAWLQVLEPDLNFVLAATKHKLLRCQNSVSLARCEPALSIDSD
jgi:hypothetical protein